MTHFSSSSDWLLERLGLQQDWLTTATCMNPSHNSIGNGSFDGKGGNNGGQAGNNEGQSGNFGGPGSGLNISYPTLESKLAKQQSADDFGIKDPQAIGSYFQQRSQFGVPANVQTPVPNEEKKPTVEINPHSMVSKSVVSIEASFNKQMQFELDDLRLSGNKNIPDSGLDKFKVDPNSSQQQAQQAGVDLFADLQNLKLDDTKLEAQESQEEARIKIAAEKSFLNLSKSNLNPFQNSIGPSPNQNQQRSSPFRGSQQGGVIGKFSSSQNPGGLVPGSKHGNMVPPSFQNSTMNEGNLTRNQISNLAFSNLNKDRSNTIENVELPSYAKDSYTNNDPSLNIGTKKLTLDKAPDNLPLKQSYNPTKKFDKDASLIDSYGKISFFLTLRRK